MNIRVFARVAGTETKLLNHLRTCWPTSNEFELRTGQMVATGDVILGFINEEGQEDPWVFLERKTKSDLLASLKDNRYRQQTNRLHALRSASDNVGVGYIIEDETPPTALEAPLYHQVLFSIRAKHRMLMECTQNSQQTAELIVRWMKKLPDHRKFWQDLHSQTTAQSQLLGNTSEGRREQPVKGLGPDQAYLKILRTVLPVNKVSTVYHMYPTWKKLHQSWRSSLDPRKMLTKIPGNPATIGAKVSAQVYETLCTDE